MFNEDKQQIDAVDLSGKREALERAQLGQPEDHWHLHAICIQLPADYEPYGFRVRRGPDCSCGCKWFLKLQALPMDWGVCANPLSPRCGLLTFEHQGCAFFTSEEQEEDERTA